MKRTDHRIVLVVYGTHNAGKRIESRNHMSETHQIALELDCAMPGLKSEGGTPHVPEVRLKETRAELVGDRSTAQETLPVRSPGARGREYPSRSNQNSECLPCGRPETGGLWRRFSSSRSSQISPASPSWSHRESESKKRGRKVHRYLLSIMRPPRIT